MGIEATLYKLTEAEYNGLPDDEWEVISVLIPSDVYSNTNFYDLQKDWSMMHYLLCGYSEPDGSVLSDAILGGEDTKIEMDFGPARYRSPQRVVEISNALAVVDLDKEFQNRDLSPEAMKQIYRAEVILEEGIDSVKHYFEGLKKFYAEAVSEEKAILSYLA